MAGEAPPLCEDLYGEILRWVTDYETMAACLRVNRMFHRLAWPVYLKFHKYPRLVETKRRWDGPSVGLATFRGRNVVFWESSDRETVDPASYPLRVWEKVLNHTGDEWADVYDREYDISFEGSGPDNAGPLEWRVRTKRWFKLYVRGDGADAHIPESWRSITRLGWEQEWACIAEVTEDEIRGIGQIDFFHC
jgi:hypothetical protein